MEGHGHLRSVCRRFAVQPMGDEKPLIQRMLGKELTLPQQVWSRLNLAGRCFYSLRSGQYLYRFLVAAEYLGQLQGLRPDGADAGLHAVERRVHLSPYAAGR